MERVRTRQRRLQAAVLHATAVDVYRKTKKRLRTAERIVKHAVEARLLFQEEFEAARLSAENASLLATKAMEEAAEYTRARFGDSTCVSLSMVSRVCVLKELLVLSFWSLGVNSYF